MLEQNKIAIFNEFAEEEASVLEIVRAMSRQSESETLEQLQDWVRAHAIEQAQVGTLGFYVDEFGARDVVSCTAQEAEARFVEGEIWSIESTAMLHVFHTS